MSVSTRFLQPSEADAAFRVFLRAMLGLPFRDVDAAAVTEPGRFLGAFDGEQLVGTADSYAGWLAVPGGSRVPHAAVTHVGVLPTHRRQGVVTALLTEQLRDLHARGEVVAGLRASEAVIYERFGYGVASTAVSARIALRRARLRDSYPDRGRVRLVDGDPADSGPDGPLAAIQARTAHPGAVSRARGWWVSNQGLRAADPTTHWVAVHSTDGVDDGYVVYRAEDTAGWWGSSDRTVAVTDLVALDDEARAGLWRHLLSLDLADTLVVHDLAPDDPLPLALTDRRAISFGSPRDETWLRLLDVTAALAARSYGHGDPVVLRVIDPLLAHNEVTLEVSAKGVVAVAADPDVTVDVATLAAAYLGGTAWWALDAAGRLRVHAPTAVPRLDALFGVAVLPFAGTTF